MAVEKAMDSDLGVELSRSLEGIEKIIGYTFKNKKLLQESYTDHSHTSAKKGLPSYERLEYVGDTVLSLAITTLQFDQYPNMLPGVLTRLRSANVDTEKLARAAVHHGLHKFVRHERPMLEAQIQEFIDVIHEYPIHSMGLIDAPKLLADIVESTIGAIYVDDNYSLEIVYKVIRKLLHPMITPETLQINPVTKFTELCQKKCLQVDFVDKWKDTGEIQIYHDYELVGKGKYKPKKVIAINRAAHNAYYKILAKLAKIINHTRN